jgi:hypothetical protein
VHQLQLRVLEEAKGPHMNLNAKTLNKDFVLQWLLHHMPMATREQLMQELPQAYNDVIGQDVAVVIRKSDLPEGITFANAHHLKPETR